MDDRSGTKKYTYEWFITRFGQAKEQAYSFVQPLDEEIFIKRPAESVWSIAECYDHLNEFGNRYLNNIRSGLKSSPKAASPGVPSPPFQPRLIWKGVIKLFAPPYKMKLKTVDPFMPESSTSLNKEETLNQFIALQDQFIGEIEKARTGSVSLIHIKVPNPLLNFVKMTLSECFAIVEVHQRRHFWQAEQILDKLS